MKVRGSQEIVPQIEVNIDTVYVRTNINRIETEDFVGWEYDELQYDKNEYITMIAEANEILESQNTELMLAVAELANASETDKIETQLAIAELANIVTGGVA